MPPLTLPVTVLQSYKALLVKLSPRGYLEEPGVMVQQAKSRIWTGVDPKGAFLRIKDALLRAQSEGRKKAQEKIRKALPPVLLKKVVAPKEFGDVFGKNGVVRAVALLAVGSVSKAFMNITTSTSVEGAEILMDAFNRPDDQPLITVSNHVSALDDPLIVAAATPLNVLMKPGSIRWTLCAHDRCFTNPVYKSFFQTTKVLPVERGAGLRQLGMRAAEYQLNQGQWVHIFPEGTRSPTGELMPMKVGVGRLVAACNRPPLVVPIIHSGMDSVQPRGCSLPKPGKKVRIIVGEPIEVDDLVVEAKNHGDNEWEIYTAISERIGQNMAALWSVLEDKPLPAWAVRKPQKIVDTGREIWHERCFKGMWSIGTDWRPLSLLEAPIRKSVQLRYLLGDYLEYCGLRTTSVTNMLRPC